MEEKIIVINCHGSVDDILSSLKEIVSKIEDAANEDVYAKLEEGKRLESYSKNVVATILK